MNLVSLPTYLNDFLVIFLSIVVEGIPFILFGAIMSAIVELWFSEKLLLRLLPKRKFTQHFSMTLLGNLMPVCECGNIPLARRMIKKNIPPALTITFLLAAPVFNPLVIAATIAAFPNDISILLYRLLFTAIIAIGAGYLFSNLSSKYTVREKLLKDESEHVGHSHDIEKSARKPSKFTRFIAVCKKDFLELTSIFIVGALIATFIQTLLPKELILQLNQQEWIAILAMMALGFIISICANVDSFFALAYSQIFPVSSILAFLVFGPMIDLKAIPMLRTIFSWRAIGILTAFTGLGSFLLAYLYFLLN